MTTDTEQELFNAFSKIEELESRIQLLKTENVRLRTEYEMEKTESKEVETKLKHAREDLNLDPFTKLLHKEAFREAGSHMFAFSKRNKTPITALYLDLNNFKEVNDTHGHPVGDTVLKEIAALLKGHFRDSDLLGRDGGDEFVALLPDTDFKHATSVVTKIEEALSVYPFYGSNGDEFYLSAAIGVVEASSEMETLEDLLLEVDKEMYEVKNSR